MPRTKGNISQQILRKLQQLESVVIDQKSGKFWPQLFKSLFAKEEINKRAIKDAFYYLKNNGLVAGKIISNQLHIYLTQKGVKEADKYKIDGLKIKKPKIWDKKWRLLFLNSKDRVLAKKINNLGFYALQKNVWIFPYPCLKEIQAIKKFFNLGPNVIILVEAAILEGTEPLKSIFSIK